MVGILIAVISTIAISEGVVLGVVMRRSDRDRAELEARAAEAQSAAVQAAGRAGAEGATAALAPQLAELDAQLAVLEALPAYCQEGDLYDRRACLLDRCLAHAAVSTTGAAKVCDEIGNLVVSAEELDLVEGPAPGKTSGEPSAADMARRQTHLRARK